MDSAYPSIVMSEFPHAFYSAQSMLLVIKTFIMALSLVMFSNQSGNGLTRISVVSETLGKQSDTFQESL